MATSKLRPLPPDYERPTLAEFLAASKTHTKDGYLPFVAGHETELRKHYVSPEEAADLAAASAPLELEPEVAPVHYFNPRAAMAKPAPFVRPTVEEWQAAGYNKDLTGDAAVAAHKKFFDDYEAELLAKSSAADPASGELSPSA